VPPSGASSARPADCRGVWGTIGAVFHTASVHRDLLGCGWLTLADAVNRARPGAAMGRGCGAQQVEYGACERAAFVTCWPALSDHDRCQSEFTWAPFISTALSPIRLSRGTSCARALPVADAHVGLDVVAVPGTAAARRWSWRHPDRSPSLVLDSFSVGFRPAALNGRSRSSPLPRELAGLALVGMHDHGGAHELIDKTCCRRHGLRAAPLPGGLGVRPQHDGKDLLVRLGERRPARSN